MLPPFGHIGGVRGPNGSTLDTVVARLDTVVARLDTVVADTAALNTRLTTLVAAMRVLVGEVPTAPAGADNLLVYLRNVLGSPTTNDTLQMRRLLEGIRNNVLFMLQELLAAGFDSSEQFNPAREMIVNLATLSQPDGPFALLIPALSQVVGDVNSAPEGSTIKDLLSSMDTNLLGLREC